MVQRVLSPLQRQYFLDRYTAKALLAVDARVMLRSTQQLGTVIAINGARVSVRWDEDSVSTVEQADLLCLAEEQPSQMWRRVARAVASVEATPELQAEWEQKFFDILEWFSFVPAGRVMAAAGSAAKLTSGNCFVIPAPHDSRKGIIHQMYLQAEIMARGGGVGFKLSSLRPRGAAVKGVHGTSSGPVKFANNYSVWTDTIEQAGSRRGALMLEIDDWHPDLVEFIEAKSGDERFIEHANLTVLVSDAFMAAVENDADWDFVFPDLDDPEYDALWDGNLRRWRSSGHKVIVYRTVKAREIWDKIAEFAHRSGEPGVAFIDRVHADSNLVANSGGEEMEEAHNPCGEQPLPPFGVCNLGSINLANPTFLDLEAKTVRLDRLADVVRTAVRFQDNVVSMSYYPLPENEQRQSAERRVGLGVMGYADMLIQLGIRYGSEASLEIADQVGATMRNVAYEASADLAKEKGSFPAFSPRILDSGFLRRLPDEIREKIRAHGLRNMTLLTVAPTGTTSLVAGVSSGIEPNFAVRTWRTDALGEHEMLLPLAEEWSAKHPGEELPPYFVGAYQLTSEEHVMVQARWQTYVDAAISKTVNAPSDHTVEDVKRVFAFAYAMGVKGITYFRKGCRDKVVLTDEKKEADGSRPEKIVEMLPRPQRMLGRAYVIKTEHWTMTLDVHEMASGEPFEIFVSVGAVGSDLMADAAGIGRLASAMLRMQSGISAMRRVDIVIDMLQNIGGATAFGYGPNRITSLPSAIAKGLQMYRDDKLGGDAPAEVAAPVAALTGVGHDHGQDADLCPGCGNHSLVREEGCAKCYGCGYSAC